LYRVTELNNLPEEIEQILQGNQVGKVLINVSSG